MREYDDYDDENIRLYTPVLQRVIILTAVIIAVPVMMWTITTFVRSYVARPRVPTLEQVASTNMPPRTPAISSAPHISAPSAADQSPSQRIEGAAASGVKHSAAETRNGPPNLASLPDGPPAAANSPSALICQRCRRPRLQSLPPQPQRGKYRRQAVPPPHPLHRRRGCRLRLDRTTVPLRPAQVPRIAASTGPIRIRPARRISVRRGFRPLPCPHTRRRPKCYPRMSRSVDKYPCRGSGQGLLPWPRPPAARCHCPAPGRRLPPPKRPLL